MYYTITKLCGIMFTSRTENSKTTEKEITVIQLKNVNKEFKSKTNSVNALSDINLTIDKGEIFGIIGTSGAGKSTLIRCINLLEKPTSGEVIVDNISLTSLSKKELRNHQSKIGMIFQHFNLFEQRDVLSNVSFALEITGVPKKTAQKEAAEMLEIVGLKHKLKAYPSQLSGGQKQRVAIARALVNKPQVLLCDEATSALDSETKRSILSQLKEINKKFNLTIVLVTHENSIAKNFCSKVAVLDSGRIIKLGKPSEIFNSHKQDKGYKNNFHERSNDNEH